MFLLLGVGDGTFLPAINYDAQAHQFGMAASDFNSDGYFIDSGCQFYSGHCIGTVRKWRWVLF
ncbi:MAG: hypothetical protein IRD7MM_01830 [Candidatus Midichloria mitochondrii]|nr:hypothetical protein [Candidatus Midichloria mitochondrii]MDJ1288404.1 hypothetical protein [Candidatus Midichloria mitochondrii]MDJ1299260.1 hypothetical protein [Candidatus Midichloria mitochondrii]